MSRRWLRGKRVFLAAAGLALVLSVSVAASPAEGTGVLTAKEVKALLENANTPADHTKLARHYAAKAVEHDAEGKEHEELAAAYQKNPQLGASKHPMAPNTAEHCRYYAEHCRKAAQELRALAAAHEEMAKHAGK